MSWEFIKVRVLRTVTALSGFYVEWRTLMMLFLYRPRPCISWRTRCCCCAYTVSTPKENVVLAGCFISHTCNDGLGCVSPDDPWDLVCSASTLAIVTSRRFRQSCVRPRCKKFLSIPNHVGCQHASQSTRGWSHE
ncbi:unnamed protein product [Linum trigynum]|uniref:Secreted protein n=1 Tax=Linum trigynum TaxID=586398 RepID=A0AAV2EEF0_9ROSI